MNIFYVDECPRLAAIALCDKHVVKMVLESAQILCSVISLNSEGQVQTPYKPTHKNHPCVQWARFEDNFEWLYEHALALCEEYEFRYGKIHKSKDVILWCGLNRVVTPQLLPISPALAMPEEFKDNDPVQAYRNYYTKHKMQTISCVWTKREQPNWITNHETQLAYVV